MATYTNTALYERDFAPSGAGPNFPRLVERAAVIAYNTINARLAGVYTTPFATTPPLIADISDLLTRSFIRQLQGGNAPAMPKKGRKEAPINEIMQAAAMLDDIVAGRMDIIGETRTAMTSEWDTTPVPTWETGLE